MSSTSGRTPRAEGPQRRRAPADRRSPEARARRETPGRHGSEERAERGPRREPGARGAHSHIPLPRPTGRRGVKVPTRRRVRTLFVLTLFIFTLFAAQLVRLQAVDASRISAEGLEVRSRLTPLPARRGAILDTKGVPLAASVDRRTILVDQTLVGGYQVRDPQTRQRVTVGIPGAAQALAPLLDMPSSEVQDRLTGTSRGATLAKKIEPSVWRKIDALGIPGVASTADSERTYPGGSPVAPLVGWVGAEGQADATNGGGGLELKLNQTLTGTPGRAVREYSRDNLVIPMGTQQIEPAVPGHDVRLTIDNDLQFTAYEAVKDQVKAMNAESGYAVVTDRQGRLRAVVQYPGFDPADRKPDAVYGSLPFQGTFEPGSTAKVMSIGAALAEGKTTPTTVYTVPNRLKRSDPQPFRDSHDHETLRLTTAGIVAQSSNIGTILIGEQMAKSTLEDYYRRFGMGSRSGVAFPGESSGIFPPSRDWNETQWYTMMFGQGMAVTAVQAAGVFQTIANKGVRIPASLVEGEYDDQQRFHEAPLPDPVTVLPEQSADEMSRMLETVVSESGTAASAAIPGVRIAGKTGTAQILGARPARYVSSFIGYAPADDPQYVVAVIISKPGAGKPIYGGVVAGPVFKKIMSYALKQSGHRPGPVVTQHYPLDEEELRNGFRPTGPTSSLMAPDAPDVPAPGREGSAGSAPATGFGVTPGAGRESAGPSRPSAGAGASAPGAASSRSGATAPVPSDATSGPSER